MQTFSIIRERLQSVGMFLLILGFVSLLLAGVVVVIHQFPFMAAVTVIGALGLFAFALGAFIMIYAKYPDWMPQS